MMGRLPLKLSMGAMFVALQIVAAGAALAHPTITASAVCVGGTAVINYTVGSFTGSDPSGQNTEVDVLVNGVVVASAPLVLPTLSFSGSTPAPAGTSAIVTALAVGTWGDGSPGGQSASVTVTIPTDCAVVSAL